MNYIISSIVLLSIIMIIVYILSIDNNIDKIKNKMKELFSVVKSKKINYLNEHDNKNLLNYIKTHFKTTDNVTIPTKIFYKKTDIGYEMNDINIICYQYNNNSFVETPYKISILFVPFEKDNYLSDQTLFGLHGNYRLTIHNNENTPKQIEKPKEKDIKIPTKPKVQFNTNDTFIPELNRDYQDSNPDSNHDSNHDYNHDYNDTFTDVLDMIPDIIHLSESEESIDTTDTDKLISHNIK